MLRPSRLWTMEFLAAAMLAATAARAQAPVLRVHLTDQETQQPLAGVLVSALDAAGAVGPSVLSSNDGTAGVRMTGAGPHRLLIRRIGFAPVTTGPITEAIRRRPDAGSCGSRASHHAQRGARCRLRDLRQRRGESRRGCRGGVERSADRTRG